MTNPTSSPQFTVGAQVTVLVGSKTGFHAAIEQIAWSDRDHCHYFYLSQPDRKLSRGYKAEEIQPAVFGSAAPPQQPSP